MAFDLIIFDCDGVLVDSERIANSVFAAMLNDLGLDVTLQDMFDQFVGRSMAQCLDMVEARLKAPVPDGFLEELKRRTCDAFRSGLRPVRGIEAALDQLAIPCCVASSGDHEKMRTTLGITNLLPRFDGKLFSVTEVARGKPFPDVFLYAARRMDADPARCAVVEDSALGVRGAKAAGMTVFGYAELSNPDRLAQEGAIVFNDMSRLPALIGQ